MKLSTIFDHLILIFGALLMIFPVWAAFMSSTHEAAYIGQNGVQFGWGGNFFETYSEVLTDQTGFTKSITGLSMTMNSMILGLGFATGKIIVSMLAAYAIVYFRFPFASLCFWLIFATLLLPLEVRIVPSYEVVSSLGLLNTYTGLILPLIASATATFFFRQFYKTVPDELIEAARIDGAGPIGFFIDILVPLSKTMMAAIFVIMFVVGWNQYLWPLIMTTKESHFTLVMGLKQMLLVLTEGRLPPFNKAFALTILAMVPPILVVVLFQRWFVKGLIESEK